MTRSVGFRWAPTESAACGGGNFFTGSHEDYHRSTDDAHTLDYAGLDRIVDLATAVTSNLVTRPDAPDFIRVKRVQQRGGGATMRIRIQRRRRESPSSIRWISRVTSGSSALR